ncbi:MAG: nuclear transport factor 2 family protein [Pseudomonadota bacterium]
MELVDLIVEENKAAARVEMKLKSNATGEVFTAKSGHFWRFEKDECVELIEYHDSALVEAQSA